MSQSARNLISELMQRDVAVRLGCGGNGALDVMDAEWFADIDWQRVQAREYEMPWRPPLCSAVDTQHYAVGVDSQFQRKFEPIDTSGFFDNW